MTQERQAKLPIVETVESVLDLKTGKRYLRSRKRRASPEPTEWERAQAMKGWWAQVGQNSFVQGAESWKQYQSAKIFKATGQNDVELESAQLTIFDAEDNLRKTFKRAHGLRIKATDIMTMFRSEAREIRTRLGPQSSWLDSYLIWTLQVLATEYLLNKKTIGQLKTVITQPPMPGV